VVASVVVEGGPDLRHEIRVRDKTVVADEPRDVGGTDEGPTPYELLLGALGACTSMTIILYAKRKGWDVRGVTVELEHDRVHVRDCADCEADAGGFLDRIRAQITVDGPLHEAERVRLEEIARRCPVRKSLSDKIRVEDELRLAAYM
jgi:putative redox protein